MKITLQQAGKRYNRNWIFRRLDAQLVAGSPVAITGQNGSGKSTLLQVIAGVLEHSEGTLQYEQDGRVLEPSSLYRQVAICAPYLELIEELTLLEFLHFHEGFKPWLPGITADFVVESTGLQDARNKQIRDFSSGMKQRVKLAQAVLSNAPVLLLDEPTSNLDTKGVAMYHQWMQDFTGGRLLVIASNDESEIGICTHRISMADYK